MNRDELVFEIENFLIMEDINRRDYIVVGNTADVLLGHAVETNDLELIVRDHLFEQLCIDHKKAADDGPLRIRDFRIRTSRRKFRDLDTVRVKGLVVICN